MQALVSHDWYNSLVDDCASIITESVFNSRSILIEGRHLFGKRILQDVSNFERQQIYGQKIVQVLAESLKVGTRTIYLALQFVRKYPNLEEFLASAEEGKNLSWNKIVTKYLPEKGEKPEKEKIPRRGTFKCPFCKKEFEVEIL